MKKIISLIIAVLLLVSALSFSVSATYDYESEYAYQDCNLPANENITFSKDFKTLYVGKQQYSIINLKDTYVETNYQVPNLKIIDDKSVEDVMLYANEKGNIIDAEIEFKDGSSLFVTFLDDRYFDEVDAILKGENKDLYISIESMGQEYFKVETSKLKTKKIKKKTEDFYYESDTFSVYGCVSDGSIDIYKGDIHILSDKIYYSENGVNDDFGDDTIWTLYEIEDQALVEEILAKQKQYYSDSGYGLFMNDEISKMVSIALFVALFILLPLAVMILSVILYIRSKKSIYKKLYLTTSIVSGVQTIIFVVSYLILF